ncbi:MAG: hypothetical protein ACR2PJ_05830, partial [Pseudomonadales bacterium]
MDYPNSALGAPSRRAWQEFSATLDGGDTAAIRLKESDLIDLSYTLDFDNGALEAHVSMSRVPWRDSHWAPHSTLNGATEDVADNESDTFRWLRLKNTAMAGNEIAWHGISRSRYDLFHSDDAMGQTNASTQAAPIGTGITLAADEVETYNVPLRALFQYRDKSLLTFAAAVTGNLA